VFTVPCGSGDVVVIVNGALIVIDRLALAVC
jgi:hypothetical protein